MRPGYWLGILSAALLGAAGLGLRAHGQENPVSERIEARLTRVQGAVYLHLQDQPEQEFIEAQEGSPMEEGDLLRTGADGTAELALDGNSLIEVAPNSDFTVHSLAPDHAEFHLDIGSLLAKIRSLLPGQNMEFHTPTAVAAVRGTELGITQGETAEATQIGVFDEGHVAVTRPGRAEEIQLGPGQQTEIRRGVLVPPHPLLRSFLRRQARLRSIRQRIALVRQGWVRRSPVERAALRARLRQGRLLNERQLKNVRRKPIKRSIGRPGEGRGKPEQLRGGPQNGNLQGPPQQRERRRQPHQRPRRGFNRR